MSSPLSPFPAPSTSPTVPVTASPTSPPHPAPARETQPSSPSPHPPPATVPSPALAGKASPSSRVPTTGSSGSRGERLPLHASPRSPRSPPLPPSPPSSSNNLSQALVVGLAAGGVVILLLLSIACFCCFSKKPQRPRPPPSPSPLPYYFNDAPSPPLPVKDHLYEQHQIWHNAPPPPVDQVVKIAPNPPLPPFAPSLPHHPVHFHPPPPLPLVPSNSEGSGSSYSGSDNPPPPLLPSFALSFSRSAFTYEELAMATDGFSDANLLGQGGFGYVHRGMLPNGTEVAVKQLKSGSGQGEREFQTEVEIISRVHHKHLVSLVGYCIADGKRLLVYEFIPNNTLEFHLHEKGRPPLDWPTRLKIALGSAKGLAYLHEDCHPKIIHRDIKASNILLDFKFEAKVADFGLAKIASEVNTYVSTRVIGTFGYLAPEYASTGKLTDRSDVFSFGVMLLELITGRRPYDSSQSFMDDSLVDWARPLLARALDDANFSIIVDPRLGEYNRTEMRSMVACAAFAVRHSAKRRPRMSQIVRALEGDVFLEHLNGVKPGKSGPFASYCGSDYDAMQYNEDMKKFRKMALGSHEYGDSGYSELTSEYGQLRSASSSSEGQQTEETEMIVGKKGKPTAYQ
ncbi:proline-rich receptor-like protein kinase PERK1 isoform X1 [Dendrobium catenatum]|uniref:non-specific serine/threonine protein kinase n=1 Tax=Dendrobium catenatum TaxID=906689 RepID=A0A2I0VF49_9ASPA|nr:proline-rich receptor-like protein kinase PERK1 isoform X1 [Dendrobium catenatum]PKU62047.1 Proline-rich receptor-like protein kinase PERK1 [Dendrobium catenatum]